MTAIPLSAPVSQQARDLMGAAARGLVEAYVTTDPAQRYAAAHLSALRAAAAVLAVRAAPMRRGRIRSVWAVLPSVAPQLAEWSAFFAAGAAKRAAAEAGLVDAVTQRQADDLVRDAESFLFVVAEIIGMDSQGLVPGWLWG